MTVDTRRVPSRGLINVMAVSVGVIVANLYYLQPLLHQISRDFHEGIATTSLLLTLIQAGYALGLAFIVPLGDMWSRRILAVSIFLVAALTVAVASVLTSFAGLAAVTLVIGLSSVGGQVLITLAADLAPAEQRGRVIARVMTGLLLGILLSRTVSGLVAEVAGWRAVYYGAAGLLFVTAIVLVRVLPSEPKRARVPYGRLVGGVFALYARERALRRRAYFGALIFACNSALWTTLSFLLSASPYHYSNAVIGLFGLFGVAGVLAANLAGHQADRHHIRGATIAFGLLLLVSFVLLGVGERTLIVLALGIVTLDAGMQGLQITNQSVIYAAASTNRSQMNSAYMVAAFMGASVGAYLAGELYAHYGWAGDCWFGAAASVAILVPALAWRPSAT